jgi:hypothetical protein
MKRVPQSHTNNEVRRERDYKALSRLALLLLCGVLLAGGFVFAAQQHFAAVRYGYESEALRREQASLIEEQRRLHLAKEQASTPLRLEASARDIGLQPLHAAQIEVKNLAPRPAPSAKVAARKPAPKSKQR